MRNSFKKRPIHQIIPVSQTGDSVTLFARELRRFFRRNGYESRIFTENHDGSDPEILLLKKGLDPFSHFIYHHLTTGEPMQVFLAHRGPASLYYHNLTPESFFKKAGLYEQATGVKKAREALKYLNQYPAACNSPFTQNELIANGFNNTMVIPPLVFGERWNNPKDIISREATRNGDPIILFTGRIAPNKRQDRLISIFRYIRRKIPGARLILAGHADQNDSYVKKIYDQIRIFSLEDSVSITGKISDTGLEELYRKSDLFLQLSEHEGFGIPAVEAQLHGLPVMALDFGGVSYATGNGAFLLPKDSSDPAIADFALALLSFRNGDLRKKAIRLGKENSKRFSPENIGTAYLNLVNSINDSFRDDQVRINIPPEDTKIQINQPEPDTRKKIAIVVQRFGKDVNGGSEDHAYQYASYLSEKYDVTVLTTCALDYLTWRNHFASGPDLEREIKILRFPVSRERNLVEFSRLTSEILAKGPSRMTRLEAEEWLLCQGPDSPDLIHYIKKNQEQFDLFLFFTHEYASTYFGARACKTPMLLVPTAHDNWVLELPVWTDWFPLFQGFLFNTPEEMNLIDSKYSVESIPRRLTGVAIDPLPGVPGRFKEKWKITGPYILYAGRIDTAKGCDELIEFFRRYRHDTQKDLTLVLLGSPSILLPDRDDIITPGFVSEEEKRDAIAGASFLVNPSPHESLSIIILEAWAQEIPVLVTSRSDVMVGQCKRSGGGLWYGSYEEFCAATDLILEGALTGRSAQQFVLKNYSKQTIQSELFSIVDETLKIQ